MSEGADNLVTLAVLRAGLRGARRRIYRHRLAEGLSFGIGLAAWFILLWSISVLIFFTLNHALGSGGGIEHWVFMVGVGGAIAMVAIGLARSVVRRLRDDEAAQRLDLAMVNHNCIATAYDLLERGDGTPMALLAIADGVKAVSGADRKPIVDDVTWRWGSMAIRLGAAGACWGILVLVMHGALFNAPLVVKVDQVALSTAPLQLSPGKNESPIQVPKPNVISAAHDASNPNGPSGPPAPAAMPSVTAQAASSAGASGGTGAGKASSDQPAGGVEASKQSTPPVTGQQAEFAKPSKGAGAGGGVQGVATGSVGAGGKGSGGASLAVEKESRRMDASELALDDEAAGDKAEADEQNENTHRGGAQPLLQDRQQAPTRELGIGGLKGAPGTGRGGPTPTKKARGAGSLFLGVPMPDYVPGKMLPGTSKIARQTIKPRRSDVPGAGAADVAARAGDESVIERFDVSPQDGDLVLRYFQALHQEDGEGTPTDNKGAAIP